jgi:hypothetical protein
MECSVGSIIQFKEGNEASPVKMFFSLLNGDVAVGVGYLESWIHSGS